MDLLIQNARLASGEFVNIAVQDGFIARLEPDWRTAAKLELDAAGCLTIPTFVNGHLHACKSNWRSLLPDTFDYSSVASRFAAIRQVKRKYTPEDVLARAEATLRSAIRHGTGALRLFADVDADAGLRAFSALLELKKRYADWLEIQIAAFPQNGVFSERDTTTQLLTQALELGAEVIGGIPWLEPNETAQAAHIDLVLDLAQRYNVPAHFVLDDTDDPTSRTAEMVATRVIERGLQGCVCGTQSNALAFYHAAHAARVIRLFKQAGMTIFSNAHVALVTMAQHAQPAARGCAPILELLRAGVPLATAQDDIDNPYYPFGRNDLLEVAQFMAHLAPLAWGSELEQVLAMVTTTPARAIGLEHYGLGVGCKANILVLDAPDWFTALKNQAEKKFVILNGKIASRAERTIVTHV
ncbi:MAG: amidohydrolase family protein [Deinococcales bacterium]